MHSGGVLLMYSRSSLRTLVTNTMRSFAGIFNFFYFIASEGKNIKQSRAHTYSLFLGSKLPILMFMLNKRREFEQYTSVWRRCVYGGSCLQFFLRFRSAFAAIVSRWRLKLFLRTTLLRLYTITHIHIYMYFFNTLYTD